MSTVDPQVAKGGSPPTDVGGRAVHIETYGCQMNEADSEVLARILSDAGYRMVGTPQEADIILLNTCAVRGHAEERVIGRAAQLHGLRRRRPDLIIGILGCMAQHLAADLPERAPLVDLVVGPDAYRRLPQLLAQSADEALLDVRLDRSEDYAGIEPIRRGGTNAWVTIIRGCDKFCAFCIVPFVRGRERAVDSAQIVAQTKRIVAAGYREVTLLGQTVNSYHDGRTDFTELLHAVCAVAGIERVRFTSPYPSDFGDRLIDAMATLPQVCPSLHLPVQSGSDAQLAAMRRGYTVGEYRDLVGRLRRAIPNLALTTDIIVGFCGETDQDFRKTCALMEEMRFDSAFMFRYSEREGTYGHKHMEDDVPGPVKGERLEQVIALQEQISREINLGLVGTTVDVLVKGPSKRDSPSGRRNYGRSSTGKVVAFPQPAAPNSLVRVCVDEATSHTLFGDVVPGR